MEKRKGERKGEAKGGCAHSGVIIMLFVRRVGTTSGNILVFAEHIFSADSAAAMV